MNADKKAYLAEEAFMILHAGEIPEVAMHGSLYYLTRAPEGPGLELDMEDILPLKQAVLDRYREIILRDLDPGNRHKSIYRGLARCGVNWERLHKFCTREGMDCAAIQGEAAAGLQKFLRMELLDIKEKRRTSCINVSQEEIARLAASFGLDPADLPEGWQRLCPAPE